MALVAKIDSLKIGDVVTWQHHGNVVPSITDGTIIGFTSGLYLAGPEAAAVRHASTYPSIPQDDVVIPDDYTKYDYIVVRILAGIVDDVPVYETREIGIPWIVPVSVLRQSRQVCTIQLEDFDETQITTIHRILKNNGFRKYTVSIS
jgi:hypothetical protein